MRPIHLVLLAVILALLAGAGALAVRPDLLSRMTESTRTIKDKEQIDKTAIGFIGEPYRDPYGTLRVPGYLDNNSKSEIRTARLSVQLVDDAGNKKEVVLHQVKDIPAGQRKTFDLNAGTIGGTRTAFISITSLEVVK